MNMRRGKTIDRQTLCQVLQAALACSEQRFARQTALAWLAAFPGDLEVTLLQARAMLAEGRPGLVVSALETVLKKDPECLAAYDLLAFATRTADPARYRQAMTCQYVLGASSKLGKNSVLLPWGEMLRAAYQAVSEQRWEVAEQLTQEAIRQSPDSLLAALLHVKVVRATQDSTSLFRLAQLYHTRYPDCLPVTLMLAEALMDQGNETEAVRLLHQCVANDAAGQSAVRLWGENHPYRSLWPEEMVILFDLPVPASVASHLGWNQLQSGTILMPLTVAPLVTPPPQTAEPEVPEETPPQVEPQAEFVEAIQSQEAQSVTQAELSLDGAAEIQRDKAPDEKQDEEVSTIEFLRSVEEEFERLAKKMKQPARAREDGRYPVYIVFSTHQGLLEQYGPQTTSIIDAEMRKLAGLVGKKAGWDGMVFYPDDPSCASQFGIKPVTERDPWKLKLALADLDKALGRRGQMIGALLIVGNDSIVPFHRLPNPTDDVDTEVPSDNPYGTLEANYFVTDWPVGRMPGEPGPDAGLLLDQLRRAQKFHASPGMGGFQVAWLNWLFELLNRLRQSGHKHSLGYTAAVWRQSSQAVFRPIGSPHTVLASPPESSGSFDARQLLSSNLGYYNLHGTEDSAAWYGQRDPLDDEEEGQPPMPDYPVALLPVDLKRNGHAPRVVFSEACYGAHTFGKTENESLALKFLSVGTLAVIGSTCVAYGSVNTPLIAADLFGYLFWQHLKSGRTVGEAVMQARVDLAQEMNNRQGYLDGEDQKTLISFVLYGDPLVAYNGFRVSSKAPRLKNHFTIKTVCDRQVEGEQPPSISGEALKNIKALVAEYLPGAELSDIHLSQQHTNCSGVGHRCPTADLGIRTREGSKNKKGRLVVTLSKQVQVAQHTHRHYIRVTLDERGKPVKLALSR